MNASQSSLDEEEWIHLALYAMGKDREDEAVSLLERAIDAFPASARAHYLLGGEYAHLALYDRAVEEMTEAVRLAPSLAAARFQLGLLHLTAGRPREAETAWKLLDELPSEDALRLFKSGLLHLARDEFAACIQQLEAGIARNETNQALNTDMQRLLTDLQARGLDPNATSQSHPDDGTPAIQVPLPSKRMVLSTYDQNKDEP